MKTSKVLIRNLQGRQLIRILKCVAVAMCIGLLAGLIYACQPVSQVVYYLLASIVSSFVYVVPFGDKTVGHTERQRRQICFAAFSSIIGISIGYLACKGLNHIENAVIGSLYLWFSLPLVASWFSVDITKLHETIWLLPSSSGTLVYYGDDVKNPIGLIGPEKGELLRMLRMGLVCGPCYVMPERIHFVGSISDTSYAITFERERSTRLAIQRYEPGFEQVLKERADATFAAAVSSIQATQPGKGDPAAPALIPLCIVSLLGQIEAHYAFSKSFGYNVEHTSAWKVDTVVPDSELLIELPALSLTTTDDVVTV